MLYVAHKIIMLTVYCHFKNLCIISITCTLCLWSKCVYVLQNASNCSTVLLHMQYSESACSVLTGYVFFGALVLMLFVWSAVSWCVPVGGGWTERRPLQYSLWVTAGTHTHIHKLIVHYASVCTRRRHMVVGSCVCVCVYLYVCNSHFSKVTKNKALANAVQA